jgi:hypothetical protein
VIHSTSATPFIVVVASASRTGRPNRRARV